MFVSQMIVLWIVVTLVCTTYAESADERAALFNLYNSTGSNKWRFQCLSGWTSFNASRNVVCDTTHTEYIDLYGIDCNADSEIVSIVLGGCGLRGTWLDSSLLLQPFRKLTTFDVSDNSIRGTLPIFTSTSLKSIDLDKNSFFGTLPPDWSVLKNLTYLYVSSNNITGTLPPSWSSLSSLFLLSISSNRLTGTLPTSWRLLRYDFLFASNNSLSGTLPSEWSESNKLKQVSLYLNNLRGPVPSSWPSTMSQISSTSKCPVTSCSGLAPPFASCSGIGDVSGTCWLVQLHYNCFNTSRDELPLSNSSYKWNWRDTKFDFGPQRTNCPALTFPSSSVTFTNAVTSTRGLKLTPSSSTEFTSTVDHSTSLTCASENISETVSLTTTDEVLQPSRYMPRLPSSPALATASWGTVAVSMAFGGPTFGTGVQRAVLQGRLAGCEQGDEGEVSVDTTAPLDIASSPTQLCIGPTATGQCVRGSIIGNVLIVGGAGFIALAIGLVRVIRARKRKSSRRRTPSIGFPTSICLRVGFPGVLHGFVSFLIQPFLTSSLTLLITASDGDSSAADIAIGGVGLLIGCGYMTWATWRCTCGRFASYKVRRLREKSSSPSVDNNSNAAENRLFILLNCIRNCFSVFFGLPEARNRTVWFSHHLHPHFMDLYGSVLDAYRGGRQWFILVECTVMCLNAVLGALLVTIPQSDTSCLALQGSFTMSMLVLGCTLVAAKPFESVWDHAVTIVDVCLSVCWGTTIIFAQRNNNQVQSILNALTEAQLWASLSFFLLFFFMLVSCKFVSSSHLRLVLLSVRYRHRKLWSRIANYDLNPRQHPSETHELRSAQAFSLLFESNPNPSSSAERSSRARADMSQLKTHYMRSLATIIEHICIEERRRLQSPEIDSDVWHRFVGGDQRRRYE